MILARSFVKVFGLTLVVFALSLFYFAIGKQKALFDSKILLLEIPTVHADIAPPAPEGNPGDCNCDTGEGNW